MKLSSAPCNEPACFMAKIHYSINLTDPRQSLCKVKSGCYLWCFLFFPRGVNSLPNGHHNEVILLTHVSESSDQCFPTARCLVPSSLASGLETDKLFRRFFSLYLWPW